MLESGGLSIGTFYLAQIGTSHVAATPSLDVFLTLLSLLSGSLAGMILPATSRNLKGLTIYTTQRAWEK
jgi:hypothetical protein